MGDRKTGQIIEIAGGNITENAVGIIKNHSNGDILFNTAKQVKQQGRQNGISYGSPPQNKKESPDQEKKDGEIKNNTGATYYEILSDNKKAVSVINHEFESIGESIAQVKRTTSARVTEEGLIEVLQFKQEIASRGENIYYHKNSVGTYKGSLAGAQLNFPDVDFSSLDIPPTISFSETIDGQPVDYDYSEGPSANWKTLNEFDAEENGGKPETWDDYLDATQTALDVIGLIPVIGEFADLANGVISLVQGDYADAALSFAAMIPFVGGLATGAKVARKIKKAKKKAEGVYDLLVKNGDDIQDYIGQSENFYKRIGKHFSKSGKLRGASKLGEIVYKMPGSTKLEREIYEQYLIFKRAKKNSARIKNIEQSWKNGGKLLNKVNPVGGRYNFKYAEEIQRFYKDAEKVIKKYNLPRDVVKFDY